jgi:ankyrin repeat protein
MVKYQEFQEELQNLRGLLIDGLGQNNEALQKEAVKKFSQFSEEEQLEFLRFIQTSLETPLQSYPLKNVLTISIIDSSNDTISTERQIECLKLLLDAKEIDQELIAGFNTPLERAILKGNLPIIRFLIEEQKAQPEYVFCFLLGLISRNFSVLSSERDLKEEDLKKVMSNSECYNYILRQINLFALEDAEDAATILVELNKVIKEAIEAEKDGQSKEIIEQLIRDLKQSQDYIENQLCNEGENYDFEKGRKICGAIVGLSGFIIPYNKLHIAILLGDVNRCKQYIESNPGSIKPNNDLKKAALMYACEARKLEIVEYLVKNGAGVNSVDIYERTALMYADSIGSVEIAQYLLETEEAAVSPELSQNFTPDSSPIVENTNKKRRYL